MSRNHELILRPTENAHLLTLLDMKALRVYESSVEGMLTVLLVDPHDSRYIDAGTRLTKGQAHVLYDHLRKWLELPNYAEAHERAYENGYERGYEDGRDRGRCEVDF